MNIQARKQALRQSIIGARLEISVTERTRANEIIATQIGQLNCFSSANRVLLYLNFGAEFAAEMVVKNALRAGKQVFLPKVNRDTKQLDLYRIENLAHDVAPGLWNIPEPVLDRCEQLENLSEIEFVLLPGVAFTRGGARLGYGGGFYDKLLVRMTHQPDLAAGAFARQVVSTLPLERTDRLIDWLVTENETICCNLGRE